MLMQSRTINLRLVEESDAAFIHSLRQDERYNRYLSKVDGDVESQKAWIQYYKKDEALKKQFYFIIERKDGVPCGTVRVYDLQKASFCWGSWILNDDKPKAAAIESAILVYDFGFDVLGYAASHFDVMKDNVRVISFHEKMGAVRESEDEQNFYFMIGKGAVAKFKQKLFPESDSFERVR